MPICPHCKSDSITYWQKLKAGPSKPAYCPKCGEASSPKSIHLLFYNIYNYICILAAVVALYYLGPLAVLIVFGLLVCGFKIIDLLFNPLEQLTNDEVAINKHHRWLWLLAVIILTISLVLMKIK